MFPMKRFRPSGCIRTGLTCYPLFGTRLVGIFFHSWASTSSLCSYNNNIICVNILYLYKKNPDLLYVLTERKVIRIIDCCIRCT